jgi:hypothetical protein
VLFLLVFATHHVLGHDALSRRTLVDGLQRRPEQYRRFFIARWPSALAIHTLPGDLELLVDQHDSLGTPAARTRYPMLVEHFLNRKSSLHVQLVGRYKLVR